MKKQLSKNAHCFFHVQEQSDIYGHSFAQFTGGAYLLSERKKGQSGGSRGENIDNKIWI